MKLFLLLLSTFLFFQNSKAQFGFCRSRPFTENRGTILIDRTSGRSLPTQWTIVGKYPTLRKNIVMFIKNVKTFYQTPGIPWIHFTSYMSSRELFCNSQYQTSYLSEVTDHILVKNAVEVTIIISSAVRSLEIEYFVGCDVFDEKVVNFTKESNPTQTQVQSQTQPQSQLFYLLSLFNRPVNPVPVILPETTCWIIIPTVEPENEASNQHQRAQPALSETEENDEDNVIDVIPTVEPENEASNQHQRTQPALSETEENDEDNVIELYLALHNVSRNENGTIEVVDLFNGDPILSIEGNTSYVITKINTSDYSMLYEKTNLTTYITVKKAILINITCDSSEDCNHVEFLASTYGMQRSEEDCVERSECLIGTNENNPVNDCTMDRFFYIINQKSNLIDNECPAFKWYMAEILENFVEEEPINSGGGEERQLKDGCNFSTVAEICSTPCGNFSNNHCIYFCLYMKIEFKLCEEGRSYFG